MRGGSIKVLAVLGAVAVVSGCSSALTRGQSAFLKRDYVKAVDELTTATSKLKAKHADYNIVKLNLALALWEKGDYAAAKEAFDDVANQIWGSRGWGSALSESGVSLKGESKREWIGKENEQIFIRIYTGIAYMMNREYDSAIVEFQRCAEKNPRYPLVEYLWGLAAREIEDENAPVHFQNAFALQKNPFSQTSLIYLKAQAGAVDEARGLYSDIAKGVAGNPPLESFDSLAQQGTNLCVVVEKHTKTKIKGDSSLRVLVDGQAYGMPYYLDNRDNRQAVKAAVGKGAVDVAGRVMRDQIAKKIPFVGLFMGGNRKAEVDSWFILPDRFYSYETHLQPGQHEIVVELLSSDGKVVSRATRTVEIVGSDLTLVPLIL